MLIPGSIIKMVTIQSEKQLGIINPVWEICECLWLGYL